MSFLKYMVWLGNPCLREIFKKAVGYPLAKAFTERHGKANKTSNLIRECLRKLIQGTMKIRNMNVVVGAR